MAKSYWWLHIAVDDQMVERLSFDWKTATSPDAVDHARNWIFQNWPPFDAQVEALANWQQQFLIKPLNEFWLKHIGNRSPTLEIDDENVIALVSTSRVSAVAIFHYALGASASATLPGTLGNALLKKSEVANALKCLQTLCGFESKTTQVARGVRLCELDHYPCEDEVAEILDAWQDALHKALERNSGVLSIAVPVP